MLDTCTSSNGTMESANPTFQTEVGAPGRINPFDGEQVAKLVGMIRGRRHFEDSLGGCSFTFRTRMANLASALSAATGWDFRLEDAVRFGNRTAAILRNAADLGLTYDSSMMADDVRLYRVRRGDVHL